jgi:polyhydroxyalkanoate synthesis regulator phasin
MSISDDHRRHIFAVLDAWGRVDLAHLEKEALTENINILYDLSKELSADHVDKENMTPQEFFEVVDELRETKRIWSRQLGDAIVKSSDLAEVSGKEPALSLLHEFVAKCPSKFYREVAYN